MANETSDEAIQTDSAGGETTTESAATERQHDRLSTQLTVLHERLDNKSRRITRAMQFNIVAATAAVGVGQLAGGSVTISLNTTIETGAALLFVSFVAGFAGLAVVGHPLASVGSLAASADYRAASADASRDGSTTGPEKTVTELRHRNRIVAVTQSSSFATGALGVGLVLLGVVRSLGVTTNQLPFSWVVGGVFAVVVIGHAVGHALGRLSRLLD